jgi:hypothetical protein
MTGKLLRYELYKVLFSYGGLLLIAAFIVIKAALLCLLPEIKDSRIKQSQKQYDKVLSVIHGESAPEKDAFIAQTYLRYKEILDAYIEQRALFTNGGMNESEWEAYAKEYQEAGLYINAYEIFYEKKESFKNLEPENLPPPAYFYEYGWTSAFTYMSVPDPLSFILILLLAVKMICPEIDMGTMSINLTTRYGRFPLFLSKLTALLLLLSAAAIISAALETLIFNARFSLNEGSWPIYSITPYTANPLPMSLMQGFLILAAIRAAGLILNGLVIFILACITGNAAQTVFCGLTLIVLPWLIMPDSPYTLGALLSGAPLLKTQPHTAALLIPIILTAVFLLPAYTHRFKPG